MGEWVHSEQTVQVVEAVVATCETVETDASLKPEKLVLKGQVRVQAEGVGTPAEERVQAVLVLPAEVLQGAQLVEHQPIYATECIGKAQVVEAKVVVIAQEVVDGEGLLELELTLITEIKLAVWVQRIWLWIYM